jgi:hypothetical protein
MDEEEYLPGEDENEPQNFGGGGQFGYTTDEGEEERRGRQEIGSGEEWMEPKEDDGRGEGGEYTAEEEEQPDYVVEHLVDDDRKQQPTGMVSILEAIQ